MASQLNNWLRQIDPSLEVGVDWQTANTESANQQIILSIKKKILNERVEFGLSGSGDLSYDVNVSYKVTQDGRLRLKGFNRRANDPSNINPQAVNTQGLGLFYRREFDYFFPKWREKRYGKRHNRYSSVPPAKQ